MPRQKKAAKAKPAAEKPAEAVVTEPPEVAPKEPFSETSAAEPPPAERTKLTATAKSGERFRSWVNDHNNGYARMTDEEKRQFVLRFDQKPDDKVIDLLKEGGFRYYTEYFGQKKVWTRRVDFEGRLRVEEIERQVRGPGVDPVPF